MVLLGAGIAWMLNSGVNQLPIRRYFSSEHTNAVWDWSNILNRTPNSLDHLANFFYMHQLNAVYVDIGAYAASSNADTKLELEEALQNYVNAMQRRNVQVYAAAGDVSWSDPDKHKIPVNILEFAHTYNERHPDAALAGVQFDIESYNQQGFPEGSNAVKTLVLTDWLAMADKLVATNAKYIQGTGEKFELGFAVPYWFDNQNGNIPSVEWNGKSGPVLFHLLDRLNELPDSNIVVMAYRNAARGNDGVIAHSRTEIDYASSKAPHVSVLIGQEVTDITPGKITYYGSSRTELSSQFKFIDDAFSASGVLGGIAINDLAGYQDLPSE